MCACILTPALTDMVTGRHTRSRAQRIDVRRTHTCSAACPGTQQRPMQGHTRAHTLTHTPTQALSLPAARPPYALAFRCGRISQGPQGGSGLASPDAVCSRALRPPPATHLPSAQLQGARQADGLLGLIHYRVHVHSFMSLFVHSQHTHGRFSSRRRGPCLPHPSPAPSQVRLPLVQL